MFSVYNCFLTLSDPITALLCGIPIGFQYFDLLLKSAVNSFLDDYDLSGKTVAPFCTSGGSGFSDSIATIKSMEPDANVLDDGLHIGDSSAGDPQEAVTEWLSQIEMN